MNTGNRSARKSRNQIKLVIAINEYGMMVPGDEATNDYIQGLKNSSMLVEVVPSASGEMDAMRRKYFQLFSIFVRNCPEPLEKALFIADIAGHKERMDMVRGVVMGRVGAFERVHEYDIEEDAIKIRVVPRSITSYVDEAEMQRMYAACRNCLFSMLHGCGWGEVDLSRVFGVLYPKT